MIKLRNSEWFLLMGLILLSFVPSFGGIFRLVELGLGNNFEFLPHNPRIELAPTPVQFHLFSAIPYCILGIFQFFPSFRTNYPKWHRVSGRFLIIAGMVSALSGLWMTQFYSFPPELQGPLLYLVRIAVSLAMIIFIYSGISSILKKRIMQHRAWMIRAYALAQGAGTQVIITIPWLLTVGEPSGLVRDILMTTGWLINILIAEWVIKNRQF